jgi:hypothetical protein
MAKPIEKSFRDNVKIEVYTGSFPRGSFVRAVLPGDPYGISGIATFEEYSLLYNIFGVGDSPDVRLKKATCRAIERLHTELDEHAIKRNHERELLEKATTFLKECK